MHRSWKSSVAVVCSLIVVSGCASTAETIDGPPDTLWQQARVIKPDQPWVVGMGDSFMSGEAGRWASNGTSNADFTENGGWLVGTVEQVYGDDVTDTESIPSCHRSATAPMFTGGDFNHANLACSGATTNSTVNQYGAAKPGVDFKTVTGDNNVPVQGQATQLRELAKKQDVEVVMLSIGGNDLGFAQIISTCVSNWILGTPCRDSDFVASRVNPTVKKLLTNRIATAITNINTAMKQAGYEPADWRLLIQLPPSPVPNSDEIEYGDFAFERQAFGGCGMLDADLDFANRDLLPFLDSAMTGAVAKVRANKSMAPMTVVDMEKALDGHRLCENGTTRPEAGTGIPPDSFATNVEWVRFISITVAEAEPTSPAAQEAMHPNYFGQRALASCMTLAIDTAPTTQRVACTLNQPLAFGTQALPDMALRPVS